MSIFKDTPPIFVRLLGNWITKKRHFWPTQWSLNQTESFLLPWKVVSNVPNIYLGIYKNYQNFHPFNFYEYTCLRAVGADLPMGQIGLRSLVQLNVILRDGCKHCQNIFLGGNIFEDMILTPHHNIITATNSQSMVPNRWYQSHWCFWYYCVLLWMLWVVMCVVAKIKEFGQNERNNCGGGVFLLQQLLSLGGSRRQNQCLQGMDIRHNGHWL